MYYRHNFVCDDGDLSPQLESGGDCHHHFFKVYFAIFQAILSFTILQFYSQCCNCKNHISLATRSVLWPKICRKCDSGRGSAPDPAGGAHSAPPVSWTADTPPQSAPLAPRCSRLWRLDCRAPLTPNPGDATF